MEILTLKGLRAVLTLCVLALGATPALADITNGNFETGDFSSWITDTDGTGAPSPLATDFQIVTGSAIGSGNVARFQSVPGRRAALRDRQERAHGMAKRYLHATRMAQRRTSRRSRAVVCDRT